MNVTKRKRRVTRGRHSSIDDHPVVKQLVFNLWPGLAKFVRKPIDSVDYNVDMLTSYGWYDDCSEKLIMMGSKLPSNFSAVDRNWQWPQKTWFRERLNAVKAQENGQRRKLVISHRQSAAATPAIETQPDTLKVD